MEKKSAVVKSKSSNSAIVTKVDKSNKKSSSNYDIKTDAKKKRGLYVDKSPVREQVPLKPPKIPRPGKKKFLASVLTILSKSTAGTQYPEKDNSDRKNDRLKPRSTQKTDADKNKKTKYKSRVLQEHNEDDIIVLKSKKEISQTPSTSSKTDNFKWSYIQNDISSQNSIKYLLDNSVYSGVAEGPAKDVLQKGKCKKKLRIHEEPTMLAKNAEKPIDKKIYNFFVDLLETTFDICNDNEFDCDAKESKTRLEVNESVVQKLVINDRSHLDEQKKCCNSNVDTEKYMFLNSFHETPLNVNLDTPKIKPRTKRTLNSKREKPAKSESFDLPKKNKKPKKDLLDILKEELKKDAFSLEEPQNLYQALKVMARNKKKTENSIRFNDKYLLERFDNKKCMSRKKVLLKSKKKNLKSDHISKFGSRSFEISHNRYPSHHSLEVYGYDYEEPVKIERPMEKYVAPLPSSSSIKESDIFCSTFDYPVPLSTHYSFCRD